MKKKFDSIYRILKKRIEDKIYTYQSFIPSEHTLVKEFSCSRNTVRRAIDMLVNDGYLQAIHGKGVRVIFTEKNYAIFSLGNIESFKEAAKRNNAKFHNLVLKFEDCVIDETLSKNTGFAVGEEVFFIQRVHFFDDVPMIINNNYFLKKIVKNLTKEIAEDSIYEYLENTLGITITNSIKYFTVELADELDNHYIMKNCPSYNCIALVRNNTYNGDGIMFEYTESRHRPDYFSFESIVLRK